MSDQANNLRKKAATFAVPVLALVCGYLVYTNIFARSSTSSAAKSQKPVAPAAVDIKQGSALAPKSATIKTNSWPTYTLDEIIGHSPFDPLMNNTSSANAVRSSKPNNFSIQSVPQSITTSSSPNTSRSLNTSSNQSNRSTQPAQSAQSKKGSSGKVVPSQLGGGLQAVFKSENGISALVDSKIVRPGDSINGVKIIAITPSAIFLEDQRTIQSESRKK